MNVGLTVPAEVEHELALVEEAVLGEVQGPEEETLLKSIYFFAFSIVTSKFLKNSYIESLTIEEAK